MTAGGDDAARSLRFTGAFVDSRGSTPPETCCIRNRECTRRCAISRGAPAPLPSCYTTSRTKMQRYLWGMWCSNPRASSQLFTSRLSPNPEQQPPIARTARVRNKLVEPERPHKQTHTILEKKGNGWAQLRFRGGCQSYQQHEPTNCQEILCWRLAIHLHFVSFHRDRSSGQPEQLVWADL